MSEFEEQLAKAADEIFDRIGEQSVRNYFVQSGDRPVPLKVTSRSGNLMNEMLGGVGSIRTVDFVSDGMVMTIGSTRPYAKLIHDGGVRQVTERMRRYFWVKFFRTADPAEKKMWSILRFKNTIKYQPRKFLENAIMDLINEIPEILKKHAIIALQVEIKRIISGNSPKYTN